MQGISQADTSRIITGKKAAGQKTTEGTIITIGDSIVVIEDSQEKKTFRIGNRGIEILEALEGNGIVIRKYDDEPEGMLAENQEDKTVTPKKGRQRFQGHWAGFDIGFNNFLTPDNSMVLPDEIYYMSLNSGNSVNVNFNFAQVNIGLSRYIGFVSGLGFQMSNYVFDGNNTISKGTNGIIEPIVPLPPITYEKSKLATRYITAPLLFEIQLPVANYGNKITMAAGPIGAVKIGSHTKTVFYSDGKQKEKESSDFSLNLLRYGFTGRVGYNMFQLYGTYYMTPLFKTGKGPVIHPFEIGISFTIND